MTDMDEDAELTSEEFDRRLGQGRAVVVTVDFGQPRWYSTSLTHGGYAASATHRVAPWDQVPGQLLPTS